MGVVKGLCREVCTAPMRNHDECCRTQCGSPWRLCLSRVLQGFKADEAQVVNPLTGLCQFHQKQGPRAQRSDPSPSGKVIPFRDQETEQYGHHVEIIPTILKISTEKIKPMPDQPREYFDPKKLRTLTASIKAIGQREPGQVCRVSDRRQPWQLLDGQRRWIACGKLGIPFTCYEVVIAERDSDELFALSVASNFAREGHTPMEIAHAINRLVNGERRYSVAYVSSITTLSVSSVYNFMKLLRLDPKIQKMLHPSTPRGQRIGINVAMLLSDIPVGCQLELARQITRERMNITRARNLIQRFAQSHNIHLGGKRGRRPSDTVELIQSFAERVTKTAQMHLEMSPGELENLFRFRKVDNHQEIVSAITVATKALDEMATMIRRAAQKVNKTR